MLRRILKMPWTKRVTDEEVLTRLGDRRLLLKTVVKREKERWQRWPFVVTFKLVHNPAWGIDGGIQHEGKTKMRVYGRDQGRISTIKRLAYERRKLQAHKATDQGR